MTLVYPVLLISEFHDCELGIIHLILVPFFNIFSHARRAPVGQGPHVGALSRRCE